MPPAGASPVEWPGVLATPAGNSVHVGFSPSGSSAGHRLLAPQSWLGAGQGRVPRLSLMSVGARRGASVCATLGLHSRHALWQLLSSCVCCRTTGHPWVAAKPHPCALGCKAVPRSVLEGGSCSHFVFPSSVGASADSADLWTPRCCGGWGHLLEPGPHGGAAGPPQREQPREQVHCLWQQELHFILFFYS